MPDPIVSIANALGRDPGVAVIYYPDLGLREWLVSEVESIAGEQARAVRKATVEEAIAHPDNLVLLVPDEESSVVDDLDGSRDQLLEPRRKHPVVLFLLRNGAGQKALARSPALASWVRGSDPDPDELARVDVKAERADFEKDAGCSPKEWLTRLSASDPQDRKSLRLTYWARLLEAR